MREEELAELDTHLRVSRPGRARHRSGPHLARFDSSSGLPIHLAESAIRGCEDT